MKIRVKIKKLEVLAEEYEKLMRVTAKQKRVLDALRDLTAQQQGRPPTLEELRAHLGYGRFTSVQRHLKALIAKGLVSRDYHKSRSYRLTRRANGIKAIPSVEYVCSDRGQEVPHGHDA